MRLSRAATLALALALLAGAAGQGIAQTAPVCPSTHVVCGGSCCSR